MGEVRVKARLMNAVDEDLVRRGMLEPEQVRTYEADALVDTGAVRMVLPPQIVSRLGLGIRGQRVAEYADGRTEAVGVTGPLVVELEGRDTLEEALVLGDEVLIGQTVLEKLDLFVDSQRQRLVPNPAHPDQPVTKVKLVAAVVPARRAAGGRTRVNGAASPAELRLDLFDSRLEGTRGDGRNSGRRRRSGPPGRVASATVSAVWGSKTEPPPGKRTRAATGT